MAGGPADLTICKELTPTWRSAWKRGTAALEVCSLFLKVVVDLLAPPTESVPSSLPCKAGFTFFETTPKEMATATEGLPAITLGFFGRHLQERLGIDYVFANELEIVDGRLTGRVEGEIVDGARKASLLKELANRENLRLEQTIAVGDGANDLPMLDAAGLGIAFHAKPKVRASAGQVISNLGLDGILYLIGMSDREVQQA